MLKIADKLKPLKDKLKPLAEKYLPPEKEKRMPPLDERAQRYINRLEIPTEKIRVLWNIFNDNDINGRGFINVSYYFENLLKEPYRAMIGEAMLELVGAEGTGRLTFSEFLEITCTFSTFGVKDLVKLAFFVIDREKSGLIDRQGLKHFLLTMWSNDETANAAEAIKRLSHYEDSFGQLTFEKLQEWVKAYPSAYFPLFRLQTSIMRTSFGEEWWNRAIADLQEKELKKKLLDNMDSKEKNKIRHTQLMKEKELVVYSQMGAMKYYIFWWQRKKIRNRVADVITNFSRDDPRNADIRFCFDD